jgi:hypothetical protein
MADDAKENAEAEELKPSDLDENTHAEMLILYSESANAVRFAKERQWKLTGAVLLVFAGIMITAQILTTEENLAKSLVLASFLVSAASIYMLIIYQIWQSTELTRQEAISGTFSSLFQKIRGQQAIREGGVHGYIIMTFMMFGIILGNAATVFFLTRFYL